MANHCSGETLAVGTFGTDVVGGTGFPVWHEVSYSALDARDID
jgi:hypothetical protein